MFSRYSRLQSGTARGPYPEIKDGEHLDGEKNEFRLQMLNKS